MISKPLFKQSVKANALVWALVTFATCFMLAVIIIVIGNSEGSVIRSAMVDAFTDDYVEAQISGNAMTYYRITDTALDTYGQQKSGLDAVLAAAGEDGYAQLTAAYDMLTGMGQPDDAARATSRSKAASTAFMWTRWSTIIWQTAATCPTKPYRNTY